MRLPPHVQHLPWFVVAPGETEKATALARAEMEKLDDSE